MAIMPCVLGSDGRNSFNTDGWEALTSWIHPHPQKFLDDVWEPFLASEHWWISDKVDDSLASAALPTHTQSKDACAGIADPAEDHPCRTSESLEQSRSLMPQTQILGVGLMKAGTT